MTKEFRYFSYFPIFPYHGCSRHNDITQRLKVVPSYIITSYLAGDYFQALRNIIITAKFLNYYTGMRV